MKEALKLALDALESGVKTTANRISWTEYDCELMEQAITAIKEALAQPDYRAVKTYHEGKPVYVSQPEQEPVVQWDSDGWGDLLVDTLPDGTLLYTTPPKRPWVGLTEVEGTECWSPSAVKTWQAIEAKLKELNT